MQVGDTGHWQARAKVEKYDEHGCLYEVVESVGNILVNSGIQLMEDLLIGGGGTVFSNANAYLGVGTDNTAASASQTDLLGTNTRKAMDATFPSRSAQTITFKSTFSSGDANHDWKEWGIFNDGSSGTMLNRKVQDFGTKSGGTWVLTATITIS